MAVYRYQVVAVGMWRGKIKRWNTTFHYSATTATPSLYGHMQATGWPNPGDAVGACSGGIASITIYNVTGGAPISQTVYFDWQTPTTWIPFTGVAWNGVDPTTPIDASGESAALVVGHMGALSVTGKPITTRKYLHAVPSRTAAAFSDPDIAPAVATALASQFSSAMANPAGVAPVTVSVEPFYFNHQRVRGRRRTVAAVAAQSFSAGVATAVGSGAVAAAPFPGQ